jgi:hypothetical protein
VTGRSKFVLRRHSLRHFQQESETEGLKAYDDKKQTEDGRVGNLEQAKLRVQVMVNQYA